MSTALKKPAPECTESYCRFGSDMLLRLMQSFEPQIGGVIEDKDIEYIHKMRVTSRKIRAVMPLFQQCYPKKKYKKWVEEIKPVTKLLGEARDIDVQIAFLQDYIQKAPEHQGLTPLQKRHKDRRKAVQAIIVKGLEELQTSGVLSEIIYCSKQNVDELSNFPFDVSLALEKASENIISKLEAFLALSAYVYKESEVLKHHEMRICTKKLRYTMEAFAPLYKNSLCTEIRVLKDFQDLLGEMHDCDVWLSYLSNFTDLQKQANIDENMNSIELKQAVNQFSVYIKERKKSQYTLFIQLWDETTSQNFFGNLQKTLTPVSVLSVKPEDSNSNRAEITQNARTLSKTHSQDSMHGEQVRMIALALFDNLYSLHRLGDYERCLLECASLLHDLGLSKGTKGHHKASMKMILTDTTLPLTSEERTIVASIARYHRKELPKQKHYNLIALNGKTLNLISALSGILRLADALDCLHSSEVKLVSVKLVPKRVLIECFSKSDTSLTQQAFDKKKDLFENFFKKKVSLIWTQQ